ncbi:ketose-bisphosphate aldolase [Verrucomicrobiota bacterium]
MSCVTIREVLGKARDGGYAVGAFNILDYGSMRAVVESAEELNAPVIIQTSVRTMDFWGFEPVAGWYRQLAGNSPVPAVLHLDHCKDLETIKKCIDAGWTSVMIDASSKPFEENMEMTRQTIEMATPAGVTVEAELGEIGGVEDDISVADEDAHLADPDKAAAFCMELEIDVFAPAIGTAHGVYKGEPKLAFDRLEDIARRTGLPIALHGGTGLSDEVFRKCISLGCAKVNISTMLKYSCINGFMEHGKFHKDDYNPINYLNAQLEHMKEGIRKKIVLFGGEGKA